MTAILIVIMVMITFYGHHESEHFVVRTSREHDMSSEQLVRTDSHRPEVDRTIVCTDNERDTKRERNREREGQKERDRERDKKRGTEREGQKERDKERDRERVRERGTERGTERIKQ